MPSERRLHPFSILFNIGKRFGALALPLLLLIVGMGTDEDRWQGYAMVFILPYALIVLTNYLSYRYRYDDNELVIRHGFIFRNQRHVPYDRIQNIDAVQNVLHRLLNVVEVRIQTGGGSEPEATLSVLALDDLEEMRRRVFGSAAAAAARDRSIGTEPGAAADGVPPAVAASRTLVRLPARELALFGVIENRGLFVIAAALGLLWELASMPNLVERFFGEQAGRSLFRSAARTIFVEGGPSARAVALGAAGVVLFLVVSRVFSIVWAFIRLYGFTVVQTGDDLRTEYGLLTRVVQTIPRRRIQTVTVRQTPLHRWLKRASVRVSTAGGSEQERSSLRREWFAPVLPEGEVEPLLASLLPGVSLGGLEWRGVHARAFGRVLRRSLVGTAFFQAIALLVFGEAGWLLLPVLIAWAVFTSRLYISRLGWTLTREVVAFRTGTLVHATTVAPLVRIQAVALHESPFDRRTGMARVRVDTAGNDGGGYDVNVPYLPRDAADRLHADLGAAAATTAFQW
jgi:putative membrane protein